MILILFPGGLIGLFQKFAAYQRWCRTTSTRAQYFERLLEICDMIDDPDHPKAGKHRDLEAANIRKSEEAVQRCEAAIRNFLNPFRIPVPAIPMEDRLYSLHSGAPVPISVEIDVMRADAVGKQAKEDFIEARLKKQSQNFFDPIKRQSLLTMENANKTITLTTSQGKVICLNSHVCIAQMCHSDQQYICIPMFMLLFFSFAAHPISGAE